MKFVEWLDNMDGLTLVALSIAFIVVINMIFWPITHPAEPEVAIDNTVAIETVETEETEIDWMTLLIASRVLDLAFDIAWAQALSN